MITEQLPPRSAQGTFRASQAVKAKVSILLVTSEEFFTDTYLLGDLLASFSISRQLWVMFNQKKRAELFKTCLQCKREGAPHWPH